MADSVMGYKCPACTGPLHYVGASGKLECDYCGSSYDVSEFEAAVADKEEKARQAFEDQEADATAQWGVEDGMKAYSCPNCGAELICDETTVATSCPYCGNPAVVPGQVGKMQKPDYILPFKLSSDQAKEALKKYYKGKRLLPNSFVSGNKIDEIKGVYVPFWLFDGTADIQAQFDATISTKYRRGNTEVTETKHFDVWRSGTADFHKVPVDASTKMPDAHMDAIEPYDYSELKPYSNIYLPGFLADKYDQGPEECSKRVEERLKSSAVDLVRTTVTGYDTCSMKDHHIQLQKQKPQYALMPVYLLSTKWNNENYLFAMNGQTGKFIGDLPVDKGKYWMWFGGITAAVTLVAGTVLMMI